MFLIGDRIEADVPVLSMLSIVAGAAFLALSLKASAPTGWIAWVTQEGDLYAPGLAAFGLDLRRLILVSARRDAEVCWALEEALRSRSLAARPAILRGSHG